MFSPRECDHIYRELFKEHPRDSARYAIVSVWNSGEVLVLLADCLMGSFTENGWVEWLIDPHTLANVINAQPLSVLARLPAHQRLTRSFRGREFMSPQATATKLETQFMLATDGFKSAAPSKGRVTFIQNCAITVPVSSLTLFTHVLARLGKQAAVCRRRTVDIDPADGFRRLTSSCTS